jgi:hypothetical protein
MSKCSRRHLQYFYNASAYGLAGEIERPMRQSIPMQAATALAGSGGRGFQRIENFSASPYVSFDAAYTEVGGSFDECHNQHTTFAYSVIEGLNIAGMITADRIVARMAIYSPEVPPYIEESPTQSAPRPAKTKKNKQAQSAPAQEEHKFDITGSYFENLRIAGYPIKVELAVHHLQQYQTYRTLADAVQQAPAVKDSKASRSNADKKYTVRELLPWGDLDSNRLGLLKERKKQYHALTGVGDWAQTWNDDRNCRSFNGAYWLSAAGHYELDTKSGLEGFGGIICIPKFGIVRLAEIVVHKHHRHLHMLRVEMCSTSSGGFTGPGVTGGGTGGGGSMPPPG